MGMKSLLISRRLAAIGSRWALRRRLQFESCGLSLRTIVISETGEISYLSAQTLDDAFDGKQSKRRASHVEPVNVVLRPAFHVLRWAFGESGRVAKWTRHWACKWRVNLSPSNGPTFGRFISRDIAIAAEERWLEANYL